MAKFAVDHVYTWVNSEDTALAEQRNRLAGDLDSDHFAYRAGASRFTDNGELRASLEGARRFLPFIRNTYIFGSGEAPSWLQEFGERYIYVPQSEIIPEPIWPNYQAGVVEAFIYKIPGLSEHYIYSNDDFFFAKPHEVDDFFAPDGRPKVALSKHTAANGPTLVYRHTEENSVRALNRQLQLPRFNPGFPPLREGFRLKGRRNLFNQWRSLRGRGLPLTNALAHVSQPYLKSHWDRFLSTFDADFQPMFGQRFRSSKGLKTNFMYQYYLHSLGLNEFDIYDKVVVVERSHGPSVWSEREREILSADSRVARYCLNDNPVEIEDGWGDFIARVSVQLRETMFNEAEQA